MGEIVLFVEWVVTPDLSELLELHFLDSLLKVVLILTDNCSFSELHMELLGFGLRALLRGSIRSFLLGRLAPLVSRSEFINLQQCKHMVDNARQIQCNVCNTLMNVKVFHQHLLEEHSGS